MYLCARCSVYGVYTILRHQSFAWINTQPESAIEFFSSWLKLFTHSPFCVFVLHFRCVALVRKFRSFCFSSRNVAHFLISLSFGYLLFLLLSTPSHPIPSHLLRSLLHILTGDEIMNNAFNLKQTLLYTNF